MSPSALTSCESAKQHAAKTIEILAKTLAVYFLPSGRTPAYLPFGSLSKIAHAWKTFVAAVQVSPLLDRLQAVAVEHHQGVDAACKDTKVFLFGYPFAHMVRNIWDASKHCC